MPRKGVTDAWVSGSPRGARHDEDPGAAFFRGVERRCGRGDATRKCRGRTQSARMSVAASNLNARMAVGYWLLAFGPCLRCPARAVKCFASPCVDVRRSPCDVVALDRPKVKSPKPGAKLSHQGLVR